jgi:hypothetical protein
MGFSDIVNASFAIQDVNFSATFTVRDTSASVLSVPATVVFSTAFSFHRDLELRIESNAAGSGPASQVLKSIRWKLLADDSALTSGGGTVSGNSVLVQVPLANITDEDGFVAGPGATFEIKAANATWGLPQQTLGVDDVVVPGGTFLTIPGAIGPLGAATPHAIRYSNGENGTFVWPITLSSRDDRDQDIAIHVSAGPDVQVNYPQHVNLPANGYSTFVFLATVPFFHQHGATREFLLTASTPESSFRLPLGIEYPLIPQPAGHHDTLYMHGLTGGPASEPREWMNTLDVDDQGGETTFPGTYGTCQENGQTPGAFAWAFPLDPVLVLGLQSNPGQTAHFEGSLKTSLPMPAGVLVARVDVMKLDPGLGLAPSATPIDENAGRADVPLLQAGDSFPIKLDWPVPASWAHLSPPTGENLVLRVAYCPALPAGQGLVVLPEAASVQPATLTPKLLRLPLREYRDLGASTGSSEFQAPQMTGEAAAGQRVTWTTHLNANGTYRLDLMGPGVSSASVVGDATRKGPTDIQVQVNIPADAKPGDYLEVVLIAQNVHSPTDQAVVWLGTTVTANGEGGQGHTAQRAPGIGAPLLAVMLAAAAFRGRACRSRPGR